MVKNFPANAGDTEMGVQPLGEEDPLEEEMATHSSILAWKIPWTESMGSQSIRQDWATVYTHNYPESREGKGGGYQQMSGFCSL